MIVHYNDKIKLTAVKHWFRDVEITLVKHWELPNHGIIIRFRTHELKSGSYSLQFEEIHMQVIIVDDKSN